MTSKFQREWDLLYPEIRSDIFALARKGFNFEPTDQQGEALEIVQWETTQPVSMRKKRIAIKSGQGTGKTTVSVLLATYRTLRDVDALTVVTAPTMSQLRNVFMAEARRRFLAAHPCLQRATKFTADKIIFGKRSNWMVLCKTASKPENFQGFHQDFMTFIIDEASGVDTGIIEQIKGTLSNEDSMLLAIGNPNTRNCSFFDFFNKDRHNWHTFTFDSRESPLVAKKNIETLIDEYGENSDVVRVRVKGEFPSMDPNCVISSEDMEACSKTDKVDCAMLEGFRGQKQFGIDLARYGSDESVIYRRSGLSIVEEKTFVKTDPATVVREAFMMQQRAGWSNDDTVYVFDAGGMGQGVAHMFYENEKRVWEFHNGGKSNDPDYENAISEAWFILAYLTRKKLCHIPLDNRLIAQLCARQYETLDKQGRTVVKIEPKEAYIKRQKKEGNEENSSPDRGDALAYAFYMPAQFSGFTMDETAGQLADSIYKRATPDGTFSEAAQWNV